MGWLSLLLVGALALICEKAINYSVRGGDERRPVGILACLLLGGAMIAIGYWVAFVGWTETGTLNSQYGIIQNTYPIAGLINMVCGGFFAIVGTFRSASGTTGFNELDDKDKKPTTPSLPETVFLEPPLPEIQQESTQPLESEAVNIDAPMTKSIRCPKCGSETEIRTAKKGKETGKEFNVCINYPECKGRLPLKSSKAATTTTIDIALLRRRWNEVVEATKGMGTRGNLYALLRSSCEPVYVDDDTIVLGFYYEFHKEKIEDPKYRHMVEAKVKEIFGNPYKLRCIIVEKKEKAKSYLVDEALRMGAMPVDEENE